MENSKPKTVIIWQNGMVMVFDESGEQMPELQGEEKVALAKLREVGWTGEPERRVWPHSNTGDLK